MSNPLAIAAENISKRFEIGEFNSRKIMQSMKSYYEGDQLREDNYLWALKEINFEIRKGEIVGIVGRNGAGKSTLLKLLSRTTTPTTGTLYANGRIASLLEVGTGFHPELTGRENVYLNSAILGMKRSDINRRIDDIIAFSGVERFIDTPVKRYSSGMYVRLAFGVAAFLEPDILVIDEVLAVGDAAFQEKAIGKIKGDNARTGRTVLFVSHDLDAVMGLTNRCMLLESGRMAAFGPSEQVLAHYIRQNNANHGLYIADPAVDVPSYTRVEVITSLPNHTHRQGDDLVIEMDIHMPEVVEGMAVSFQVVNSRNVSCLFHYIFDVDQVILRGKGTHTLRCIMPACELYKGQYHLTMHLAESKSKVKFQELHYLCRFEVIMAQKPIEWGWQDNVCVYMGDFHWEIVPR